MTGLGLKFRRQHLPIMQELMINPNPQGKKPYFLSEVWRCTPAVRALRNSEAGGSPWIWRQFGVCNKTLCQINKWAPPPLFVEELLTPNSKQSGFSVKSGSHCSPVWPRNSYIAHPGLKLICHCIPALMPDISYQHCAAQGYTYCLVKSYINDIVQHAQKFSTRYHIKLGVVVHFYNPRWRQEN